MFFRVNLVGAALGSPEGSPALGSADGGHHARPEAVPGHVIALHAGSTCTASIPQAAQATVSAHPMSLNVGSFAVIEDLDLPSLADPEVR